MKYWVIGMSGSAKQRLHFKEIGVLMILLLAGILALRLFEIITISWWIVSFYGIIACFLLGGFVLTFFLIRQ
jgi:hypothetical protein